MGFLEFKTGS